MRNAVIGLVLILCFSSNASSQISFAASLNLNLDIQEDEEPAKHSPKRAAIMSAILPGLGQAYNRKYWKIPIIYGGAAIVAYSIDYNFNKYNLYRNERICRLDTTCANPDLVVFSDANILELRDYYRKYIDVSFLSGALLYVLNIVDANVDGHLYDFNVGDDLSFHIQPVRNRINSGFYSGLSLSFNFNR
ncbi:MAG: hypothetical protein IIA45_09535 [Bacteroidetes bacterium]|nr:hypothetical protein [Bacteroidota bacterium]